MTEVSSLFARRRAGLAAEREAEAQLEAEAQAVETTDPSTPDLNSMSDAEALEALDLPDPDTLSAGDDFTAFMAKTVPARLRNRALRKLWRSNPVLACLDGLNDYDDDYLKQATGQSALKTTYQVGKGMLAHIQDVARQQEAAGAAPPVAAQEEEPATTPEVQILDTHVAPAESDTATTTQDADENEVPNTTNSAESLSPRRMRFAFEGDVA